MHYFYCEILQRHKKNSLSNPWKLPLGQEGQCCASVGLVTPRLCPGHKPGVGRVSGSLLLEETGKKCYKLLSFKMSDSVPVPREVWYSQVCGTVDHTCPVQLGRGPRFQERPPISGAPAACWAGWAGKAAGMGPWCVLWLQSLVDTLTGQPSGPGAGRWTALTLWLPQKWGCT